MRAVTIRRMIVFGVCALGVGSLYLVPGVARSPEQIRLSGATDEPSSPVGAQPSEAEQSASTNGNRDSIAGGGGQSVAPTSGAQPATTRTKGTVDTRSTRKTAEARNSKDSEPPQPVAEIDAAKVTSRRLSINWPAATDNVGVIGYRIWLNGFEVATTAETKAKLRWFNDDSGQHVVQIRAVDAAGNQSRSSPTLVITRPSPGSSDSPTPEPSDSPTPRDEPSEPSHSDADSPKSPSAKANDQDSTPDPEQR
jgi:hypothetical protein